MHREGLIALPAPQHKVNPCRAFIAHRRYSVPAQLLFTPNR
jgi:hypothetical protein